MHNHPDTIQVFLRYIDRLPGLGDSIDHISVKPENIHEKLEWILNYGLTLPFILPLYVTASIHQRVERVVKIGKKFWINKNASNIETAME